MVPQELENKAAGLARCFKLALMGSHGVGKTTLCFELAARLKRRDLAVDMVKEVARSCPLPLNQATTVDAQSWILYTQMAREIETARDQDVLVCDRSVLDNYAYLAVKFGRLPHLDPMVADWISTYGLLVLVPVMDGPRFDGVRDTDRAFQLRIEGVIEDLVRGFRVQPLRLARDDRDGWVDQVLDAVPVHSRQLPLFGDQE